MKPIYFKKHMNNMAWLIKILLMVPITLFFVLHSMAQDVSINIISSPSASAVGSTTSKIQVQVCNNDGGTRAVPAYKLRPLITTNSPSFTLGSIDDLPAGWSVCTSSGTGIRVSSGTDEIPAGECRTFNINLVATATPGSSAVTANISFGGGTLATACTNGPGTVLNNTQNDGSSTSFEVTSAPLSVNLLSFNGKKIEEAVALSWASASEKDFSHYEITYSTNGKEFSNIGKVDGQNKTHYNYVHKNPQIGDNYYRLRMVDLDGSAELSKTINVDFDANGTYFSVENPGKAGKFNVSTNAQLPKFLMHNNNGSNVDFKVTNIAKNKYIVQMQSVVAGIYHISVANTGLTKKVVIP